MVLIELDILEIKFFTDEAWFHLGGYINSLNTRMWFTTNPHVWHEAKTIVWVGISRMWTVGPLFFKDTVNSDSYCADILTNYICQLTEAEIEQIIPIDFWTAW